MALGLTQPVTNMSTRNLPGDKGQPARKADNVTTICELIDQKIWEPRRLTTLWASTACYLDSFTVLDIHTHTYQSSIGSHTQTTITHRLQILKLYLYIKFNRYHTGLNNKFFGCAALIYHIIQ
jgi:hypothetical protein